MNILCQFKLLKIVFYNYLFLHIQKSPVYPIVPRIAAIIMFDTLSLSSIIESRWVINITTKNIKLLRNSNHLRIFLNIVPPIYPILLFSN